MNRIWTVITLTNLLLPSMAAASPTAAQIAESAFDETLFGTANARATIDLSIYRSEALWRTRRISTLMKTRKARLDTLVEFLTPPDVAGTRFLSRELEARSTQQLIYLPAFKKVKRIVGAQRTNAFMRTDFSYYDMEGRRADEWIWTRLADDAYLEQPCFVITGAPKDRGDAVYGKVVVWVHQRHEVALQTMLYDRDGVTLLKTHQVHRLEKHSGRWVAMDATMQTLSKNTRTRLQVATLDLDSEIPDDALTRAALRR